MELKLRDYQTHSGKVPNNGGYAFPVRIYKPKERPTVESGKWVKRFTGNGWTIIEVEAPVFRQPRGREPDRDWSHEEEQVGGAGHSYTRKSMAKGAVENVLTVLRVPLWNKYPQL